MVIKLFLSILDNIQIKSNVLSKDKRLKAELIGLFYQFLKMAGKDLHILITELQIGGKGIIGIINSSRNGNIASSLVVSESDEILYQPIGSIMRCAVKEIITGRNTQGVRIKKLSGEEKVVSVIKIEDNIQ